MEDQQQTKIDIEHKWSSTLFFLLLSIASHTFVNKYVLSVLQFQYPTVFISWQCGSCVFLLMSAYVLGYLDQLANVDRTVLQTWAPCMALHAGIMYTGSISLSKLAIPIFLGLQNLTCWFTEFLTYWRSRKLPSVGIQFSLIVIGFGAIYVVYSDLSRDPVAYKWVLIYVACSGCYVVFSEILRDVNISNLDKTYCNSLFSVISLTSLSILTGEWRKTMEFQFLYYIKFHVGCICSGLLCCITGVVLNLLARDTSSEIIKVASALNNALVSLISLGIFEISMDTYIALSVIVLFIGGMAYNYLKLRESTVETEDLKSIRNNWE